MTYLITFACYGCHLHGDDRGSVDRNHNLSGSRFLDVAPQRVDVELSHMDQPAYLMDESRRQIVLESLIERCANCLWTLRAAHVRTNHVHVVIESDSNPERVMNDLKAFASAHLNQHCIDPPNRKRWARHGSTRWLHNRPIVLAAIQYVINKQGDKMSTYESP